MTFANPFFGSIEVSDVTISGADAADFSETNTCTSPVAGGNSCQISVTFTPQAAGARTATLTFTDNSGSVSGSTQTVSLSGTGTAPSAPVVSLSATSVTFSGQVAGSTSLAQSVTLSNNGSAALSLSSIAISGVNSGSFAETNTCGNSVGAGANCMISVTFKPTASGTLTGTLTITDNAAGSPQTISLSGTGEDFSVAASSGSTTSATVAPGGTATYNLNIAPGGGLDGTVSFTCSGAPSGATCGVNPSSVTLNGTGSAAVTVSVATTAASAVSYRIRSLPSPVRVNKTLSLALGLMALLIVTSLVIDRLPHARSWASGLALACLLIISGCGGGGGSPSEAPSAATPAGTYNLTVTAMYASGTTADQHTITLSLTIN